MDTHVTVVHSRQCELGRRVQLPCACGERDMADAQPQTAKVIVMGSTQSLSSRRQPSPHSRALGPQHNDKVLLQFAGRYSNIS